jgi:uncharacterized membrane protein YkvA (DUF1232 family)
LTCAAPRDEAAGDEQAMWEEEALKNDVNTLRPAPGSARALASLALQDAVTRSQEDPGFLQRLWADVSDNAHLYRAWIKKEYPAAPWKSLLLAVATAVYFINPVDLVPDFLLLVGYVDDVTLMTLLVASMRGDAQRFRQWRQEQAALPVIEADAQGQIST